MDWEKHLKDWLFLWNVTRLTWLQSFPWLELISLIFFSIVACILFWLSGGSFILTFSRRISARVCRDSSYFTVLEEELDPDSRLCWWKNCQSTMERSPSCSFQCTQRHRFLPFCPFLKIINLLNNMCGLCMSKDTISALHPGNYLSIQLVNN